MPNELNHSDIAAKASLSFNQLRALHVELGARVASHQETTELMQQFKRKLRDYEWLLERLAESTPAVPLNRLCGYFDDE